MTTATRLGPTVELALRAFPRAFRDEFEEEMRIVSADLLRDAQPHGPGAVAWTRTRLVTNLLTSAAREHARREHAMHTTTTRVLQGLALAIGLPLLYLSFISTAFWSALTSLGEAVGFDTGAPLTHPLIILISAALIAVGLMALATRVLDEPSALRRSVRIGIVAACTMVAVGGLAGWAPEVRLSADVARNDAISSWLMSVGAAVMVPAIVVTLLVGSLRRRSPAVLRIATAGMTAGLALILAAGIPSIGATTVPDLGTVLPVTAGWLLTASSILAGAGIAVGGASTARRADGRTPPLAPSPA